MNSERTQILNFVGRFLCFFVVCTMLFPTIVNTTVIYASSDHAYELMVLDHHEESEKEEQQEDDSKDEKIEMQVLHSNNAHFSYASERANYKPQDAASDYILEIPFPPPERM